MTGVTISSQARQNLAAFQMISNQIDDAQTRLSTGKRVNNAFDDPAAYFTSSALNTRAASLNQLADNVSGVKSLIDAANNGVQAITSLLSTAQSLANSALANREQPGEGDRNECKRVDDRLHHRLHAAAARRN